MRDIAIVTNRVQERLKDQSQRTSCRFRRLWPRSSCRRVVKINMKQWVIRIRHDRDSSRNRYQNRDNNLLFQIVSIKAEHGIMRHVLLSHVIFRTGNPSKIKFKDLERPEKMKELLTDNFIIQNSIFSDIIQKKISIRLFDAICRFMSMRCDAIN